MDQETDSYIVGAMSTDDTANRSSSTPDETKTTDPTDATYTFEGFTIEVNLKTALIPVTAK